MGAAMSAHLPVQYHIEIYVGSLYGDPIYGATASTPFATFALGDFLNGRSFGNASQVARRLRILEVEHILWTIEDSHIGHKLMIATEEVDETL
jgi:hypothetical protein